MPSARRHDRSEPDADADADADVRQRRDLGWSDRPCTRGGESGRQRAKYTESSVVCAPRRNGQTAPNSQGHRPLPRAADCTTTGYPSTDPVRQLGGSGHYPPPAAEQRLPVHEVPYFVANTRWAKGLMLLRPSSGLSLARRATYATVGGACRCWRLVDTRLVGRESLDSGAPSRHDFSVATLAR
jgi:hypothetical protein